MQALILAGGEGTRLRPLTSTVPKPVVPLVDRPLISYMLEWIKRHGVDDVIMSCGFLAAGVRNVLGDGSDFGMRLRFVEEPEPLGTAGALKFAESMLDERFLMLNGDVLTDIDLTAQFAQHELTGAKATLALVAVPDPTNYGLVRLEEDAAVREFVEKPSMDAVEERPSMDDLGDNMISAGAYVLEREILEHVPAGKNVSIEREVWPVLVGNGLYGYRADTYWLDIGTPERYLRATFDIIEGNVETAVRERLGDSYLAISEEAEVEGRAIPPAVLERGVHVARGRARRVARGARPGRVRRCGDDSRALGDPQRHGNRRALPLEQLHRRGRMPHRRGYANQRRSGAGRGRDRRGGKRHHQRRSHLPRSRPSRRRAAVLKGPREWTKGWLARLAVAEARTNPYDGARWPARGASRR